MVAGRRGLSRESLRPSSAYVTERQTDPDGDSPEHGDRAGQSTARLEYQCCSEGEESHEIEYVDHADVDPRLGKQKPEVLGRREALEPAVQARDAAQGILTKDCTRTDGGVGALCQRRRAAGHAQGGSRVANINGLPSGIFGSTCGMGATCARLIIASSFLTISGCASARF